MKKTKYQLMDNSSVTDSNGDYYPDLATFPIDKLRTNYKPSNYNLNENDIYRFYNLTNEYYGSFDFYDYMTLWLNDIRIISEDDFNKTIKFYDQKDLDDWFLENLKETVED